MLHYALTLSEARRAKLDSGALNDWIDPGDFRDLPARAALCRTGDGHAQVVRDWSKVDCPACLAKRGSAPKTIMRADYMTAGQASGFQYGSPEHKAATWKAHCDYYGQFVGSEHLASVKRYIGLERLLASTDEHLNDIPLHEWDNLPLLSSSVHDAFRDAGTWVSQSDMVCLYKEAGRQLIEQARDEEAK